MAENVNPLYCKSIDGKLVPVDEKGEERVRKIAGKIVEVDTKQPRNLKYHRRYWALVNLVYDSVEGIEYPSVDELHSALKIMCGVRKRLVLPRALRDPMTGEIILPANTVCFEPGSIAFHRMSEETFEKFFNRLCDIVATYWWPGITQAWLRAEVEKLIGMRDASEAR